MKAWNNLGVKTSVFFLSLSVLIGGACTHKAVVAPAQSPVQAESFVFSQIETHALSRDLPLGGSYENGVEMLRGRDAQAEAYYIYNTRGLMFLVTQTSPTPPGVKSSSTTIKLYADKKIKFVEMPDTNDVVKTGSREYRDSTRKFATQFNLKMIELGKLENK